MAGLPVGERAGELSRARTAVVVAFAMNGLCFASWLSRAPAARDALSLSPAQLGLLLLCLSGGASVALPTSGPAVHRLGAGRVVLLGSVAVSIGLLGLAVGLTTGVVWPAAVGLALTGVGMGNWDVAMNVEGAEVERRRGWSLMPRLHAAFSLGTVTGGGAGAASAALDMPLAVQVVAAGLLAPASMVIATRSFLPIVAGAPEPGRARELAPGRPRELAPGRPREPGGGLRAWVEPRTLLVGVLTLAFGFTEGTANDWLAVALVDGHHTGEVLGAIGFGVFVTAMTVGRLGGGAMLERFGRVAVLRGTAVLAVGGLLLVILASSVAWVLVGALLWGLGASLGFPVGMSAAADDPTRAAIRVSVVSSIAYTAFLAGPPLLGFLAQHIGILRGLFVVLGALVVGALVTPAARQPLSDPSAATTSEGGDRCSPRKA